MRSVSLLVGLGMAMAAPAAVHAQTAPAAQADQGSAASEKKICRREEGVGSRLGKRLCLTRAQWADLLTEQANQRNDILGRAEREDRDASPFGDRPR